MFGNSNIPFIGIIISFIYRSASYYWLMSIFISDCTKIFNPRLISLEFVRFVHFFVLSVSFSEGLSTLSIVLTVMRSIDMFLSKRSLDSSKMILFSCFSFFVFVF